MSRARRRRRHGPAGRPSERNATVTEQADRAKGTERAAGGPGAERAPSVRWARRQRIVDAALAALERQPYEQIRIAELAQAAEVALGTLYRYFPSKEHLYAVVLQEWVERDRHRHRQTVPAPARRDRARSRIHAIIAAFERQPQFYRLTLLLSASTDPEVRALLAGADATATMLLAGDFAGMGVPAPRDRARMLYAISGSTLTGAVYHGRPFADAYRLADRFLDLCERRAEAARRP
ncbi:TetR family transcriptional regulator [Actinocorallia herbida]|uniref:TetR family transcriptional regulator n=2 Tax=Actinocorallia herbida TaxID=58109 RepID=A0A3N1CW38_9ACTN|nr:TetR family transcriptional regulator [Actinocorallia herbida]